ncbi:hypothetical protein SKAU_G00419730 [Synaphobranchus kaupii]|uniref:Thioredoxin domain-containing protein n=1 Tax=Synaphobranchus kaupii TaxID=118154 RepID=A0A9Q1IB02_SYNKA|nr:hypothetical protein SKAU_G00419730 [Synaphobranchus kaupii]
MADLPPACLRLFKPAFHSTGMDCFGPLQVKANYHPTRDAARAFSDQGTNFWGGEMELWEAFAELSPDLKQQLAKQRIAFNFNPPAATHFGGVWERESHSMKTALYTMVPSGSGAQSCQKSRARMKGLLVAILECTLVLAVHGLYFLNDDVVELKSVYDFERQVLRSDGLWLIEFYASWCPHCQTLAADWKKIGKSFKDIGKVGVVNTDHLKELLPVYKITSVPTIKIFGANKRQPVTVSLSQSLSADHSPLHILNVSMSVLSSLVWDRMIGKADQGNFQCKDSVGGGREKGAVKLMDHSFNRTVLFCGDLWLVAFLIPGCAPCNTLKPHWEAAAPVFKSRTNGKGRLGVVDTSLNSNLADRFMIRKYPTIKIFHKGLELADYQLGAGKWSHSHFIAHALALTPQLFVGAQILNEDVLKKTCEHNRLCFISVLPHMTYTGVSQRNADLDMIKTMAPKYGKEKWGWLWTEAGAQKDLESALGIGGFGYPAMAAINIHKMKFALFKGSFKKAGIKKFLSKLLKGEVRTMELKGGSLPKIHIVKAWDSKNIEH